MAFNLDKVMAAVDIEMSRVPWNLQIKIGERVHTVRPLTEADAERFAGLKPGGEEAKAFLSGLFEGEAPEWDALPAEQVGAVCAAMASYVRERRRIRQTILNREVKLQFLAQRAEERGE